MENRAKRKNDGGKGLSDKKARLSRDGFALSASYACEAFIDSLKKAWRLECCYNFYHRYCFGFSRHRTPHGFKHGEDMNWHIYIYIINQSNSSCSIAIMPSCVCVCVVCRPHWCSGVWGTVPHLCFAQLP